MFSDIRFCSFYSRRQKDYTYHSFLPDDAHAVLNTRQPVWDLCEVILAHGLLLDGERTVVRRHHVQSIAARERDKGSHWILQKSEQTLMDSM